MKYKIKEGQYTTLIERQKQKNKLKKQLLLDISKIRENLYDENLISETIVDKINHYKKKYGNIVDKIIESIVIDGALNELEIAKLS